MIMLPNYDPAKKGQMAGAAGGGLITRTITKERPELRMYVVFL